MSAEKANAQAGHAYTQAYLAALFQDSTLALSYECPGRIGTKISLVALSLDHLLAAYREAKLAGLPCALVTDEGHVHPPDFDGSEIITALGIGPATREQVRRINRRFRSRRPRRRRFRSLRLCVRRKEVA